MMRSKVTFHFFDYYLKKNKNNIFPLRNKSTLNLWNQDINTEIKHKIERHWSKEVLSQIKENTDDDKKPFYVLPMFPYPSGNLHMGHVRVYSISDTLARFKKLCGMNVIHPIGWDAFGLPAENAAIERNIPPHEWTKNNISSMKKQLQQLGYDFNWDREISTCDPKYYKWTQYIFLKLYEKGLAYQTLAQVNWDPVDKTVLADEQVDDLGCSWRSGAKVEKKYLTQWFVKTTKFAKQLYDGLSSDSLENWKDIINLQRHWIGKCNGVAVTFILKNNTSFEVWTDEPYKFIHGDFLVMDRQNALIHEMDDIGGKQLVAYNPVSELEIPIYINDDLEFPEGRDVYLGCASVCEKDKMIASILNIETSRTKKLIDFANDNNKAVQIALDKNIGGHFVSSKLKDWLISRQRYWGTPIPIIHCKKCGIVPVPYDDLPVELPINNTKTQTLSSIEKWVNCKCPDCDEDAKRETDTMDTFVDSSWYYYRFLDPHNDKEPFSLQAVANRTPVDIYVGGKEHAVLHLYYARFMSYFLHSLGWTKTAEPFKKLVVQGMVMGQSYKIKSSGKYIPVEKVELVGKEYKEKVTGETVAVQWEKMSKSKYNGENPERLLKSYGSDTTKLLMLADVPPATQRRWSDATLPGVLNWQHRIWLTLRELIWYRCDKEMVNKYSLSYEDFIAFEKKLWESRNFITATTTFHFKYTQKLSVGISRLQTLTNTMRNNIPPEIIALSKEYELALISLIIMLSPVTPHFCSELWAGLASAPFQLTHDIIDWKKPLMSQYWPVVDDDYLLSYQCKVDGADRCELKIKASDMFDLNYEKALELMLKEQSIQKRIKSGIIRTKYEWYPDCRAILHIYTNRKQEKVKDNN